MLKTFYVTEGLNRKETFQTVETVQRAEKQLFDGTIDAWLEIKAKTKKEAISKFYKEQEKFNKSFNRQVNRGLIKFDDVIKDEHGTWTQVCKSCVLKYKLPSKNLHDTGFGICGVKGCSNESDYYYDFDK